MAAATSSFVSSPSATSCSPRSVPASRAAIAAAYTASWAECLPIRAASTAISGSDVIAAPCASRLARIRAASTRRPSSSRAPNPSAAPVSWHASGSTSHSAFQLRAVPLVQRDEPLQRDVGVGAHDAGERVELLGELRVPLVRHGDAADGARYDRLAELADLGPLQLEDLVADLREACR